MDELVQAAVSAVFGLVIIHLAWEAGFTASVSALAGRSWIRVNGLERPRCYSAQEISRVIIIIMYPAGSAGPIITYADAARLRSCPFWIICLLKLRYAPSIKFLDPVEWHNQDSALTLRVVHKGIGTRMGRGVSQVKHFCRRVGAWRTSASGRKNRRKPRAKCTTKRLKFSCFRQ